MNIPTCLRHRQGLEPAGLWLRSTRSAWWPFFPWLGVLNFAPGSVATMAASSSSASTTRGCRSGVGIVWRSGADRDVAIGVLFQLLVIRPIANAPVLTKIVGTLGLLVVLVTLSLPSSGTGCRHRCSSCPIAGLWRPVAPPSSASQPADQHRRHGGGRRGAVGALAGLPGRGWPPGQPPTTAGSNPARRFASAARRNQLGSGLGTRRSGLGSLLASLVQLTPGFYTELMIAVLAAAALVGGFQSFGLAVGAAIIIGSAQAVLSAYDVTLQNATGVPGWSQVLPSSSSCSS